MYINATVSNVALNWHKSKIVQYVGNWLKAISGVAVLGAASK